MDNKLKNIILEQSQFCPYCDCDLFTGFDGYYWRCDKCGYRWRVPQYVQHLLKN